MVRCVLPTLWARFNVPIEKLLPRSMSLLSKELGRHDKFEEQLKFRGWPKSSDQIEKAGWALVRKTFHRDTYLNPNGHYVQPLGEIMRIREDQGIYRFMYKGPARDRLLSHRPSFSVEVSPKEADEIIALYPKITQLNKTRLHYRVEEDVAGIGDSLFTLHIDSIEDRGSFTEIRALGSSSRTHTRDLLDLAHKLGFSPADMLEGNYLSLALEGKL